MLSGNILVAGWELGQRQPLLQRALTLLAWLYPQATRQELAALTIGQRDAGLMTLYRRLIGERVQLVSPCPTCAEKVAFTVPLAELSAPSPTRAREHAVRIGSYALRFRLPTSIDMLALAGCPDVAAARSALLERCVVAATPEGHPVRATALPEEILAALIAEMERRDPLAEVLLQTTCPVCGHSWQVLLDIVTLLWSALDRMVRRLFHDVHSLAKAYSWSESEILALSHQRRKMYLALVDR